MTHLGERVSALVDGQLPVDAVERAHAHLAHCRDCRDAVEAERLMKARLSCLPTPEPASDLVGRLLAMGGPSGPLPPRPGHVPGSPRPVPVAAWQPTCPPVSPPVSPSVSPSVPAPLVAALAASPAPPSGGALRAAPRPPTRGSSRPAGRPGPSGGPRRPVIRPTGRPAPLTERGATRRLLRLTRQRARLAGALLGALGVVGAGISGLVLLSPGPGAGSTPARVPFDSFVVQRPSVTPTLNLAPRTPSAVVSVSTSPATRSSVASATATVERDDG